MMLFSGKQTYFPEEWYVSPGNNSFSRKYDIVFRETNQFPGGMIWFSGKLAVFPEEWSNSTRKWINSAWK
jgi:hypothetical protein